MTSNSTPPSSQLAEDVHPANSAPPSNGKRRPAVRDSDWESIDSELKRMLSPISELLHSNSITTTEAGVSFTSVVHDHLYTLGLIYKCNGDTSKHHDSKLVKLSKKLSVAKNNARKNIHSDTRSFLHSVRLHNKVKKLEH